MAGKRGRPKKVPEPAAPASSSDEIQKIIEKYKEYRNGGGGCGLWAEENLCAPIYEPGKPFAEWFPIKDLPKTPHKETGRSPWGMWQEHKKILKEALRMENGKFVHSLIVFCWPRGEAKSFLANVIIMWRFFCFPRMKLVLCANSKEQSSFLQYNEIRSMIENSPKLLNIIGKRNIQEKEIRRRVNGKTVSKIQTISSFSGIVSNITGYTFSEFFECKQPEFFEKIDTSLRNIPNAFGILDSTVSSKDHPLYRLYQSYVKKEDPAIYFSYRYSDTADYRDYWNPNNTPAQLHSLKIKHPFAFDRFFKNLWSAGAEKVFSQEDVDAFNYIGADNKVLCHAQVVDLIRRRHNIFDSDKERVKRGHRAWNPEKEIQQIEDRLWPVTSLYRLDKNGVPICAEVDALDRLSEIYDTDWAIIGGIDRADPMKIKTAARTMLTLIAKGLPGSRSNPNLGKVGAEGKTMLGSENSEALDVGADHLINFGPEKKNATIAMPMLSYVYFLLYVVDVADHSLEMLKTHILIGHEVFDGIDVVGGERYGLWDLSAWGDDYGVRCEIIHPTYNLQAAMFTYFCNLVRTGRFKGPPVTVQGSKEDIGDIVREEMMFFDHDADKRWFGSPEKKLKYGVQDDWMFAAGNAFYAGRLLNVESFRPRRGKQYWGEVFQPTGLMGNWFYGQ
jgi:hypothetical protein